jgi:hypothetical protein
MHQRWRPLPRRLLLLPALLQQQPLVLLLLLLQRHRRLLGQRSAPQRTSRFAGCAARASLHFERPAAAEQTPMRCR